MDSDRPPERWSLLDAVGWFLGLWPVLKERLHGWLHKGLPHCPNCIARMEKADEWAEKCRAEEAAHKATVERLRVAPGTPVLGGPEEGMASWPVTDADLAIASNTLLTGQRSKLAEAKPVAPELPAEPTGPLTYAQFIASREPRPLVPFPKEQIEAVRGKVRSSVTADCQTVEMCHRRDGKPAITTAEIVARAQEMVNAREAEA